MRVAIIGQDYPEASARYISKWFARLGHETELFIAPSTFGISKFRADLVNRLVERSVRLTLSLSTSASMRAEKRMAAKILKWFPDLVVTVDAHLWPDTVRDLGGQGAKVVLWFLDALVNFGRQIMFVAPYDRIFLKDPYMVRYCSEIAGLPAHLLPEGCDPEIHRPLEPAPPELVSDVAMIGNIHPSRVRLLEQLLDFDIKVWGRVWPRWLESPVREMYTGRFLAGDDKAMAMRCSKSVLNNLHYGEIESSNCRMFEAAGCGAFQLAEWRPGFDSLFRDGEEIVYYRSASELRDLLAHWLPRDEERRAVGDAACSRAHAEHTFERRLERLLEVTF